MSILRLLLAVVAALIVGSFVMGPAGGERFSLRWLQGADTADPVARARHRGVEIAQRTAGAATKVEQTLSEAALSAKIKAKMALDDTVKARDISVTTRGTTVTLSGTVASKAERDRAVSLARETAGVTKVVADLHTR